jgi:hypothetical protein
MPGDIVTCEAGHEHYRILHPQQRFTPIRAKDFETIEPYGRTPISGHPMAPTCQCGAKIMRHNLDSGGLSMHFKDHGWWPSHNI